MNTSVTVFVVADSLLMVSVPVVSSSALFFKKTSSTDRTESVAVKFVPANNVASAAIVVNCSVVPSESNVNNLSPFAGVTSLKSEISTVKVTSPVVPPPLNPSPAVTPVIPPELGADHDNVAFCAPSVVRT